MEPFLTHKGVLAVLPEDNIDTDRIIPARYLSRVSRLGYGELLFHDVRDAGFVLDSPEARDVSILVTGTNFGCGSSREHAVWALQQAGFKAVIARKEANTPGFSDIFRQNSANCGLLLIELEGAGITKLYEMGTGNAIQIDLPNQVLSGQDFEVQFEMNPVTKNALVLGLDLIGTTLAFETEIAEFEARQVEYAK